MDDISLSGGFQDIPVQSAVAFRAALNAMARPGVIQPITGAVPPAPMSVAAGTLILTLTDPEAPVHLAPSHDLPEIRDWIRFHTGAPLVGAEEAAFVLGNWSALQPLDRFAIGTPEYPDRSATLIVEVPTLENSGARLTGPGIKDAHQLNLPEPERLALNGALFPLGLDFYFTAGDRVAGLPRTTKITVTAGEVA